MKIRRILFRVAIILCLAWLGLVVLAALFYPRLLYHPGRNLTGATPLQAGAEAYREVWLAAADGVRLNAWFVPAAAGRARGKTLLAFHGNAGDLSTAAVRLALYSNLGFDVFMVDYHGFGKSGGKPNERNLYLDAEAAWRYLTAEQNVKPNDVVILGYSLGGAVAAWLAERQPGVAGLVLESTFTSLADIGGQLFPFLPAGLILGDSFNTLGRLPNLKMPLLVIHGPGDELVAFANGERLFAAYAGRKEFMRIAKDHNLGFMLSGAAYGDGIARFADSLVP